MNMARPQKYTQDQVILSAGALFKQLGYRATSIDQLLEVTNLSRSSLYNGFGNKEALYIKVLDQFANESACLYPEASTDPDPSAFIRSFYRSYFSDHSAHKPGVGCLLINTIVELSDTEPELVEHAMKYLNVAEQSLSFYFSRSQNAGNLPGHLNPQSLARFFMHIKQGLMVSVRNGTPLEELSDIVETSLEILK